MFCASPCRGTLKEILIAVDTAVDGDNAFSVELDGVAVTGGSKTLTTAHTAGTILALMLSAANTVNKGTAVEAITDGGGTVGKIQVTYLFEQE